MNGAELRTLRQKQGWNIDQVGRLLKEGLGRGSASSVRNYERAKDKEIPADIAAFLNEITFERKAVDAGLLDQQSPEEKSALPLLDSGDIGDTAPPPPSSAGSAGQPPLSSGTTAYARVCEELFEMIATGVGMIGAATANEALLTDSAIIHADKEALGKAYGKLAETNDTFRKMVTGMTEGGAVMQVAFVTGITASKIMRNHQPRALPPGDDPGEVEVRDDGRGNLVAVS